MWTYELTDGSKGSIRAADDDQAWNAIASQLQGNVAIKKIKRAEDAGL
jgi:hypothetical protein